MGIHLSDSFCSLAQPLVCNASNFVKRCRVLVNHQCPFNSDNSGINCGRRRSSEEMPRSFKSSQSEQINIRTPQCPRSSPPRGLCRRSRHVTSFSITACGFSGTQAKVVSALFALPHLIYLILCRSHGPGPSHSPPLDLFYALPRLLHPSPPSCPSQVLCFLFKLNV